MFGKTRASLLSFTIIAVIIFSAFGPTIAYADGETPEAPPAEATAAPEEAPAEETSTETTSEAAPADSDRRCSAKGTTVYSLKPNKTVCIRCKSETVFFRAPKQNI